MSPTSLSLKRPAVFSKLNFNNTLLILNDFVLTLKFEYPKEPRKFLLIENFEISPEVVSSNQRIKTAGRKQLEQHWIFRLSQINPFDSVKVRVQHQTRLYIRVL